MIAGVLRLAALALVFALALVSPPATAEPVTLKLSFITSDRSNLYQCYVKPFVDAVNNDSTKLVQIKVYFSGAISPEMADQAKVVLDGAADLAYVVPGYSPQHFPDISVLELPGIFRNEREASLVFARLIAAGAINSYRKFFVVGAFLTTETIHSRRPIAALADLKGQTIRVNNQTGADALRGLGAIPSLLPINQTMEALSQQKLDGVAAALSALTEFGLSRIATHHYLLSVGSAPISLVMNREKFAGLSPAAQTVIRAHSGEWLSERGAACFEAKNNELADKFRTDPRRTVVMPSPADLATARSAFAAVVDAWEARSPRHRELLALVKTELRNLRSPNESGK